jgi:ATP synthase F1 gamma subunit
LRAVPAHSESESLSWVVDAVVAGQRVAVITDAGDHKNIHPPNKLPVGERLAMAAEAIAADTTEFLFEPGADDLIGYLIGHYLNIFVHVVLLNAKASEQSARMVSMKSATDNAESMIKELTLAYNKLRQGHITQELLEIAGGQSQ